MKIFDWLVQIFKDNKGLSLSLIPIIFLVLGFFIWNIYLYTLGFVEDEIIRARFIITGLLFTVVTLLFLFILKILWKFLNKIYCHAKDFGWVFIKIKEKTPQAYFGGVTILLLVWLVFYSVYMFPSLPLVFGGGQPRALSLLAVNDNLKLLKSLEIIGGDNASNQTENVCVAYESNNRIIVLRRDRILAINRSVIEGFGSLPGLKDVFIEPTCVNYARDWSRRGFFSQLLVSGATIFNRVTNTLRIPVRTQLQCN